MPGFKNPGKIEFDAVIVDGSGGGAFVKFPKDVEKLYGVKGRVPVKATFDGIPYRGSLAKMDSECHVLGVLKQVRETLKKGVGDKVHVVLELDTEERTVDLAQDVSAKVKEHPEAKAAWDKFSYTHKKEHHEWIESAKRDETRTKRIVEFLEKLTSKS
jgi:hypothetical protein